MKNNTNSNTTMLAHRQMRRVPQGWRHPFYHDSFGLRCFLPIPRSAIPFTGKPSMFQMYEIQTAGTPISPIFATKEELVKWLVDSKITYIGPSEGTEEEWNEVINQSEQPEQEQS